MTFFTRAATTALTGLAIFGFASAAFAHHSIRQPFVEEETRLLLNAVKATGHHVVLDEGPCKTTGNGMLGAATTSGILLICAKNHGGDLVELADTIRHEAFHLAQFCKGRKHGATSALIVPDVIESSRALALELHMPVNAYAPDKRDSEAEARAGAYLLEEAEVASLLIKECGVRK